MAGNFFHPTHPRPHMHIRLTLLTQIVIFWGKNVEKGRISDLALSFPLAFLAWERLRKQPLAVRPVFRESTATHAEEHSQRHAMQRSRAKTTMLSDNVRSQILEAQV